MTTAPVKRTFSMRPEVDHMLTAHVERTPGASLSSTVNDALLQFLEQAAMEAYRQWDADAPPEERAALDAFATHDTRSMAGG
jgi:hypothetical protein